MEAMQKLDQTASKVLYLLKHGKLVGSLSDGDIRRWILSGGSLDAPISNAVNFKPKFLMESCRQEAGKFIYRYSIDSVPIINDQMELVDVVIWGDDQPSKRMSQINLPVVMMAGGQGTRLYPYTKVLPKPLIPVGETPISEMIMDRFYSCGCEQFYLIVNCKKNMIKAYFHETPKPYQISYIDETEPLGTGGGLQLMRNTLEQTFILTNCDILLECDFADIYELHRRAGNAVTMICSLKNYRVPYGVVEFGVDGEIRSMQEKPTYSFFTNTGSYLVEPEVIDLIKPNERIGFPEIIARCQENGWKTGVYPINEGDWMDMGQLDELEKMRDRLEVPK